MKFKKGDAVYYHHRNGDTYPAIVLMRRDNTAKITYDGLGGDITAWVSVYNLSFQDPPS